jgi:hypothetical protein
VCFPPRIASCCGSGDFGSPSDVPAGNDEATGNSDAMENATMGEQDLGVRRHFNRKMALSNKARA